MRRDGDRLRVTAQLVRAEDGFRLWGEDYDRTVEQTFEVQVDIAEKIAAALNVVLDDDLRAQMQRSGLRSPEAFVAWQKALEAFEAAHASAEIAEGLIPVNRSLEEVLAIAPNFSDAYLLHADRFAHLLIDEPFGKPHTVEERAALIARMEQDMENAIATAPDEASRLAATYDLLVTSGKWSNLGAVMDQIVELEPCVLPQWYDVPNFAFGRAHDMLVLSRKQSVCNPLGFHGWFSTVWALVWLGRTDEAIDIGREAMAQNQHELIAVSLISAYLAAGRVDDAARVVDTNIHVPNRKRNMGANLDFARGRTPVGDGDVDRLLADGDLDADAAIVILARAGRREDANRIAAQVDGWSSGHMILLLAVNACRCGAAWDIDVTPNFARRLEEGGMPWPPSSPIDWPLKVE